MLTYQDIASAIKIANRLGYHCIGRDPNETSSQEWVVYPASACAPQGVKPDMLCIGHGNVPIPMTRTGTEALRSLVKEGVRHWEADLVAEEGFPMVRGCSC